MKTSIITTDNLIHWANALRQLPHVERTRFLDSMWSGQLESKAWLVNHLHNVELINTNIYIFGGWTGILANMLLQDDRVNKIRSIDIDPWCEGVADNVNKIHEMNSWRFKAVTADMSTYQYQSDMEPDIVINTSTEHVTQDQYDSWYNNIPMGTIVVAQGNDYFTCGEHIRCTHNLSEFEFMNRVINPIFRGVLPTDMYQRFMCIWKK
jgi:hypothetical protein